MGLQAIEAGPRCEGPVPLSDQDTGDRTTACRFLGTLLRRLAASIAPRPAHWLPESGAIEDPWERGTVVSRASVTLAVCFLWPFIGAAANDARCDESASRAIAKQASEHEQHWDRAEALARALTSSLRGELDAVRSTAEAERFKQEKLLNEERGRADTLSRELALLQAELDKVRIIGLKAAQATEAETKHEQALVQERARADALTRDLTSVRADLDTARAAAIETAQTAEAAKVEQERAFGKERDTAEALARELAAARKEVDTHSALLAAAHAEGLRMSETDKILAADQEQALASQRDRADALARELASVRAELDKAQMAGPKAIEAETKQRQALDQEREKAQSLTRELSSVRADLDAVRAAAVKATRNAEAAKIEQEQAYGKQHDKAEALASELAAARKEVDARSALLAAAHAEVLRMAETDKTLAADQKEALANQRNRADALARELASLRAELDKAQMAGPKALEAETKQKQALDQEREKAENLTRELSSVRADLDTVRAAAVKAAQDAAAAKIEQDQAFGKERDKAEALGSELAAARKEVDARSALLAAVHAEIMKMAQTDKTLLADQKQILASERERADALARELASTRGELDAGKRQIATLNALVRRIHAGRPSTTRGSE
jgi:hypothetical protein